MLHLKPTAAAPGNWWSDDSHSQMIFSVFTAAGAVTFAGCGAETAGLGNGDIWDACREEAESNTVRATNLKSIHYPHSDEEDFTAIEEGKVRMQGVAVGKNDTGYEWEVDYTCTAWKSSGVTSFIMASTGRIIV